MTEFVRARSDAHRAVRRQAILDAASELLADAHPTEITLGQLASRANMVKSNVQRYFESREAVLLELLLQQSQRCSAEIIRKLRRRIDPAASFEERARVVASVLAETAAKYPQMCQLLGAQSVILERTIAIHTAITHKTAVARTMSELAETVAVVLPELQPEEAARVTETTIMLIGTVWAVTHPPQAVAEAYRQNPELRLLPQGFVATLTWQTEMLLRGSR